ncbi:MAG: right-handed parallel beta-helix repeat-containing protein [Thermoplasmata archaeon]|nr:MAG: right-handed parallel beta-helix repeat-containing protein [Thermoplasmata archaeon]
MTKKVLSSGFCLLFVLSTLFTSMFMVILIENAKAEVHNVSPGESIQMAIENATTGDTVYIKSGTYYENITISEAISLVGENRSSTVIDGGGEVTVIQILDTNSAIVESLTVKNAEIGINIFGSDNVQIGEINVSDCHGEGVYVDNSNNFMITDSFLAGSGSGNGITALNANDLEIHGNMVKNFLYGIDSQYSSDSLIVNNNIMYNVDGIRIRFGSGVNIQHNTLYNNSNSGLSLLQQSSATVESTKIDLSGYGIYIDSVSSGTVYNSSLSLSYFADLYVGMEQLTLVNTSFDPEGVIISQQDAVLTVKNFLDVHVEDSDGNPVLNADVIVKDDGNIVYDSTTGDSKTDGNGLVRFIEAVFKEYVYDPGLDYEIMESTTSVEAIYKSNSLSFLGEDQENVNMSTSHMETFQLDTIPPTLLDISSHGNISLISNNLDRDQDDSLAFVFRASEPGSYVIIINTSGDNEFNTTNDTVLAGTATGDLQTVFWNGTNETVIFPDGNYFVEITLIDEFDNPISEPYTAMIIRIINTDLDGDGHIDTDDDFPNDATQWSDNDNDGFGDNPSGNNADAFPSDPTQWLDSDGDGHGDNPNGNSPDAFVDDVTQWLDSDGDSYGDNESGNDPDAFPDDPSQWMDLDGDGYGDNETGNKSDAFPNDPSEWLDSDGDGHGDNGDKFPDDPKEWEDSDGDGIGDNSDFIPINNWLFILIIIAVVIIIIFVIMVSRQRARAALPFDPGAKTQVGAVTPSRTQPVVQPRRKPLPPPPKRIAAQKRPPAAKSKPSPKPPKPLAEPEVPPVPPPPPDAPPEVPPPEKPEEAPPPPPKKEVKKEETSEE